MTIGWKELVPKYQLASDRVSEGHSYYFICDEFTFHKNIVADLRELLKNNFRELFHIIESDDSPTISSPAQALSELPFWQAEGESGRAKFGEYFKDRVLYIPDADPMLDDPLCVKYLEQLGRRLEKEGEGGILCMVGTKLWTEGLAVAGDSQPPCTIEDITDDRLLDIQIRELLRNIEREKDAISISKLCCGIPALIDIKLKTEDDESYYSEVLERGLIPKPDEAGDEPLFVAISHLRWRVFHPPKSEEIGLDNRLLSVVYDLAKERPSGRSNILLSTVSSWIRDNNQETDNDSIRLESLEVFLKNIAESSGVDTEGMQFRAVMQLLWVNGWFPWGPNSSDDNMKDKSLKDDGVYLFQSMEMARNRETHDAGRSFASKIWFNHFDRQDGVGVIFISLLLSCIVRDKFDDYDNPLYINRYDGDSIRFTFSGDNEKPQILHWDDDTSDFIRKK